MEDTVKGGHKVSGQLFGTIRRLPVIGDLPVPVAELFKSLPDPDYATHFFCSGCGTVLPVLKGAVVQIAGSELPAYENHYIAVERCDLCNDHFVGAQFNKIPTS